MDRFGQKPAEFISNPLEYVEMLAEVPLKVRRDLAGKVWELPQELQDYGEREVVVRLYMETSWRNDLQDKRVVIMKRDEERRAVMAQWGVMRRRFIGGDGVARIICDDLGSGQKGRVFDENSLVAIGLMLVPEEQRVE